MRRFLPIGCFLILLGIRAQAPGLSCAPEDLAVFERLMQDLGGEAGQPVAKTMVPVGKAFLGTPYRAQTLEVGPPEVLVVNFRGLDCTTFVENVLVLSRMLSQDDTDWESYLEGLEQVRYRHGKLRGYPSRLHYFTDWIRDNEEKGLVRDITRELDGVRRLKNIDFMGTHRELYPLLASDSAVQRMRELEVQLSAQPHWVLPKEAVALQEEGIRDGDIIALATQLPGLDVTHTGIAVRMGDGRVHLLHASTRGQVMITETPLAEYIQEIKGNEGIVVVRPLDPRP